MSKPIKQNNKHSKFTSSSISFQIVVFVLTFILGWFGEKVATKVWYIFHHSFIPTGATIPTGFDITQGWNDLCNIEGVWPMVFIGEIVFFGIVLATLLLVTRKARKNEEIRESERDKKLDDLPKRIAEELSPMISAAISEGMVAGMRAIRESEQRIKGNNNRE